MKAIHWRQKIYIGRIHMPLEFEIGDQVFSLKYSQTRLSQDLIWLGSLALDTLGHTLLANKLVRWPIGCNCD